MNAGPGKGGPRGRVPLNLKDIRPPDKNSLKTLKRLFGLLGRYRWRMAAVAACIIISSAADIAGSLFIKILIDDCIAPLTAMENPVFTGLFRAISAMGCIYLAGMLASFAYNRIMVTVSQNVLRDVRDGMFGRMQTLPVKYFDANAYGDLMSRYVNDTDALAQMASSVPQIIKSGFTVIGVLCAMLYTSPLLTLLVLACLYPFMKISSAVAGGSAKYFALHQKALGELNGYIEEMINGQKVVSVFCREEQAERGFDRHNGELRRNAAQAHKFANILMPILGNLGHIQYVLLLLAGGLMAVYGVQGMTLGNIAAFPQLSKNFNMPINQLSQQLNSIVQAMAGAGRIFALMDEEGEADGGSVVLVNAEYRDGALIEAGERTGRWAWKLPGGELREVRGDVRFHDVSFGYGPEKPVLRHVSLYARPGQKIAFVGATGAGKTTIANLISRFYDIQQGEITYDGIDIREIRKNDLRRSLGMVLQEVNLFTGTVRDNIRYGNLSATDGQVEAAAKLANAHDFIMRLPQGYDTMLTGDGGSLSQGQRQLLSIARAACEDAPVMILDEATSSIDTRTEAIVQGGMDKLMRGRTVFVIAHRLSTVRNADAIMVLEEGRVTERGSHDDLIAQKGKYYRLYTGLLA